jgi:putative oxidoreductase
MTPLIARYKSLAGTLDRMDGTLATAARFLFAAILLMYFWVSGLTKLGDGLLGLFQPALGAYAQIFPKAMEAAGYDVSQLGLWHTLVVLAGTWAEFILPALIVLGLATRLVALGMIGFVIVQSLTDMFGHGLLAEPGAVGAWFDRVPDSVIMDQRALWIFLLAVLVLKGAGPLSLDRLVERRLSAIQTSAA